MKHLIWRLRNPWTWPVLFEIGCWWERRYRPERLEWKSGAIEVRLDGPVDNASPQVTPGT